MLLLSVFLVSVILFTSCATSDLRGWWKPSHDGKTYLVVEPGGDAGEGEVCKSDGQDWPYSVGERGEIKPGEHEIGCTANVGFIVKPGVEYHFDYWGP